MNAHREQATARTDETNGTATAREQAEPIDKEGGRLLTFTGVDRPHVCACGCRQPIDVGPAVAVVVDMGAWPRRRFIPGHERKDRGPRSPASSRGPELMAGQEVAEIAALVKEVIGHVSIERSVMRALKKRDATGSWMSTKGYQSLQEITPLDLEALKVLVDELRLMDLTGVTQVLAPSAPKTPARVARQVEGYA